ncbi:gp12 [Synechococcus phage Syn5]|uniref:Gp12 n=1 Tax=Synechococcus phage Syn5 TaxID=2914003 RepID=A4ZR93_9CAUD|nr:gp12 [Synechococcus phage Syn5]ABP87919.1 gp12 [Synechococcus phage Syn5]
MTASQLTSTELCAALPSRALITAVDSLGEELLATGSDCFYFDTLSLAFDTIVAELTARGLWLGEES